MGASFMVPRTVFNMHWSQESISRTQKQKGSQLSTFCFHSPCHEIFPVVALNPADLHTSPCPVLFKHWSGTSPFLAVHASAHSDLLGPKPEMCLCTVS